MSGLKSRLGIVLLVAAASVPIAGVAAQDTPVIAPAPTSVTPAPVAATTPLPECEVHVFPTLEGQAQTTGWLSGFGIIGALADASANKDRNIGDAAYLKEALGPQMQVEALQTLDLAAQLNLPPSQVIFETPIADRDVTTKAKTRLSASTAPCYAELIVTQNLYKKAAIYGRSLNNRFIFKDFRTGKKEAKLLKGRGGNGLKFFPPKTTEEAEVAENELRDVFVKNFLEFVATLKKAK